MITYVVSSLNRETNLLESLSQPYCLMVNYLCVVLTGVVEGMGIRIVTSASGCQMWGHRAHWIASPVHVW
jgi:hypothetical protein